MADKSYHVALLASQGNLYAGLGSMALAALAAIPFGIVGAALPLIAFGVGEVLALLVIPDLPNFRSRVDQDDRRNQRTKVRAHLITEIKSRLPIFLNGRQIDRNPGRQISEANLRRISDYNKMISRIQSLSDVAADSRTQLGMAEIERLHEASANYLSLWLASIIMESREQSVDMSQVKRKLAEVEAQLRTASPQNARGLRQAQNDYQSMLTSRSVMAGKAEAIEAAMLSMPDKIEEIYQMVLSSSFSPGLGGKLEDSLSRLRLEEELEEELNTEFNLSDSLSSLGGATVSPLSSARAKQAASQKTLS